MAPRLCPRTKSGLGRGRVFEWFTFTSFSFLAPAGGKEEVEGMDMSTHSDRRTQPLPKPPSPRHIASHVCTASHP